MVKRDKPNAPVAVILETDWYSNSTIRAPTESIPTTISWSIQKIFKAATRRMGILTKTSQFSFWNSVSNRARHEGPGTSKNFQNGRACENQIVFALHGKYDFIK